MSDIQTGINSEGAVIKRMGFFQRLTGVVISPGRVMEELAEKPRVLFPILLMAFAPAIFIFSRLSLFKDMIRESMQLGLQQQNVQLTAEQIEMSINISAISTPIILPIILILAWLTASAVILGIMKILKGEGVYKQYLSVSGYALVIPVISVVLNFIISFFSGKLITEFSPALFIQNISGSYNLGFLKGLLSGLDIFTLWGLAVTCIGFKTISRLEGKKVYLTVFGLYILFTVLSAFAAGSAALKM